MNNTVYSLWIGDRLPRLQRLCIESWIRRGYSYRLFVYEEIDNAPSDVVLMDGTEILPTVYRYADHNHLGHPALHANLFRYTWLSAYGGTWADADTTCLKRLPHSGLIISSEPHRKPPYWFPDLALIRVPPRAAFLEECRDTAQQRIRDGVDAWGQFGPKLLRESLQRHDMNTLEHVAPPSDYCPIPCWLSKDLVRPHSLSVPRNSYGCHLWSSSLRADGCDIDAEQDPNSAYERILEAANR